jgi:hypothetical protein
MPPLADCCAPERMTTVAWPFFSSFKRRYSEKFRLGQGNSMERRDKKGCRPVEGGKDREGGKPTERPALTTSYHPYHPYHYINI